MPARNPFVVSFRSFWWWALAYVHYRGRRSRDEENAEIVVEKWRYV